MLDPSAYCARAPGLKAYETEDSLIVHNPATDRIHHLNPTASVIFELCEVPVARQSLIEMVVQLYSSVEPSEEAIEAGIQSLFDEGILIESHR